VKYHQLATNESLFAHACIVNKIVLVVNHSVGAGIHVSPKPAAPVDQVATALGANNIPFHIVEAIIKPLVGICR
jgi:uncharacterized membrane protein YvlD (DUF360 family)